MAMRGQEEEEIEEREEGLAVMACIHPYCATPPGVASPATAALDVATTATVARLPRHMHWCGSALHTAGTFIVDLEIKVLYKIRYR